MSDLLKGNRVKKIAFCVSSPHSLDDVLQDLQPEVSHNSWLGFVS